MKTKARLVPVLALLIIAVGCTGSGKAPKATYTGKVTYKNAAVTGGTMNFYPEAGGTYVGTINPDGTYDVTNLPPGDVKVTIDTEPLNPASKENAEKAFGAKGGDFKMMSPAPKGRGEETKTGTYVKIPDKYRDPNATDLKFKVEAGRHEKNFDLTD